MSSNVMRQIEKDKHVPTPVEIMVWCGCLDLLALSNSKGEVQLHRLNWHKVWSLAPPMETSLVKGIAWRPDGKVLAIGYSCGRICLVDVEDKEILYMNKVESGNASLGGVTCLSWRQKSITKKTHLAYGNFNNVNTYIPILPVLNSNYKKNDKNSTETKRSKEQTELNILLVGYENGEIHMSVFGQFPCGILDMKNYVQSEDIKIIDAQLSRDFTTMHVFVGNNKDNKLMLVLLNTEVLAAYGEELHGLATKHVHITGVISYIDSTVTSIIEAWEQILLEMDSKLEKYACNVAEGGVSADFLDLLILGVPSAELELFLLQDLTGKGLKKFSTSIELSYSTIQKLVLKQLNTVCQNLSYHLTELRGLARIPHRYQILGLDEDVVDQAIISSTAFINKCLELQQVIEHSMKNYKAFFRWLYLVIVRLMDDSIPSDITKINQQDLTYIAEFLQNFDKVGVEKTTKGGQNTDSGEKKMGKFSLERLGQYLVDKELTITPDDENNPWIKFLSENPCLLNNPCIIQNFKKFSLVQQQIHLKNAIQKMFNRSEKSLTAHFRLFDAINCVPSNFTPEYTHPGNLRLSQINDTKGNSVLVVFTDPCSSEKGFYFMEILFRNDFLITKCTYFYFHASGSLNDSKLDSLSGNYLSVVDVQFYSTEIISVLLEKPNDDDVSAFVQFPVELCKKHCKEISIREKQAIDSLKNVKLNALAILEKGTCNILDKLSAVKLAVSGSRKVAVVLSKTFRKVRLFEMEADGEEDDDDTLDTTQQSHSSTHHSDQSQYISMNETGLLHFSEHPVDENQLSESIDLDNSK